MRSFFSISFLLLSFASFSALQAEPSEVQSIPAVSEGVFKTFTGKVIGNNVRMRAAPDLESHIVLELSRDDYVIVTAEKGDFYSVKPPSEVKAFIFRGFVIDEVVEGDRVNVRLAPHRDAPIIAHHNAGAKVTGTICEENNKWLEIQMPPEARFFISKEFIEYAGKPDIKAIHDKRKGVVKQLFESARTLTQTEMLKPFDEIDKQRVVHNYQTIIDDYAEFSTYVDKAAKALAKFQEDYLHRKVAHLELKTSKSPSHKHAGTNVCETAHLPPQENFVSPTDRMKIWEPIEEALYLSWSAMHHAKTIQDFYQDQKMKGQVVSGILESYKEPIKSKPGDYILKERDVPFAYVYSTHIDLEELVGKRVTLTVSPRENNNFAFPAFYVLDVK